MSQKHRVKGWWLICLMAGCVAPPLWATEAVSRAVEVPPPQGWTPDTPLFHDEGAMLVRDEAPAQAAVMPPVGRQVSAKDKPGKVARTATETSPKPSKSSSSPRSPEAVSGVEPNQRIAGKAKLSKRSLTAQQKAKASRADQSGGRHAKANAAHPSRTPAEGRALTRTTQAKQATRGKASVSRQGTHVAAATSQAKAPTTKRSRAQQLRQAHQAEPAHAPTALATRDRGAKARRATAAQTTHTRVVKASSKGATKASANSRTATGATRAPVKVASSARRAQLDARTSAKRAHPGAVKKG